MQSVIEKINLVLYTYSTAMKNFQKLLKYTNPITGKHFNAVHIAKVCFIFVYKFRAMAVSPLPTATLHACLEVNK